MAKKFYVTTAIDYTNDVIHCGHAYQKIVADVLARYYRLLGDKVFFLTGTDEHGTKSEQAAKKAGQTPKEFVDEVSAKDKEQLDALNISYDRFIRTTDPDHQKVVADFYLKVRASGDIYKGEYEGLYCIGCETYKTLTETVNGKCPLHPNQELEKVKEENYFFKWSKYADFLKKHIQANSSFILPESQRKNMLGFLEQGLEDIAISRPKKKVAWGIPVPDDSEQTVFVWFDALINYLSGAPDFWPADVHILGKDNVRWHALLWPAMLKSAGYDLPKIIYGHAFITLNGQKISKSLGNVIRPTELVKEFGVDGVRYFFLRFGPLIEDVDISLDKIRAAYNADLANGLGNTVARITKLSEKTSLGKITQPKFFDKNVSTNLAALKIDLAIGAIWKKLGDLDKKINQEEPWKISDASDLKEKVYLYATNLLNIAYQLRPFLPETAKKIQKQFAGTKIKSEKPLFPRL
jgi:methionyl-tRNA synthetase